MTHTTRRGLALAASLTIAAGLAACGNSVDDAVEEVVQAEQEAEPAPVTTERRERESSNDDAAEFADFMRGHLDEMSEGAELMDGIAAAAEDYDLPEMIDLAWQAADIFGDLHDEAVGAPGADSALGRKTIEVFATCTEAFGEAAVAAEDFDAARLSDAAELIGECGDGAAEATELVPA